jgi:hypothetical protein
MKEKANHTIKLDKKLGFLELIDVPTSLGRGQRAVP